MVYADFMNGDDSKTGVIFIFFSVYPQKNTPSLSFRTGKFALLSVSTYI